MLRTAVALSALAAGLLTAAPAAAQSPSERDSPIPPPCRVALNVERLSCNGPIGRSGPSVPPAMRAILFGPAWALPTVSEAGGPPQGDGTTMTRRAPAFARPVVHQ